MNKELENVVNLLIANDNLQTGEDGGVALSTLAEYLEANTDLEYILLEGDTTWTIST